MCLRQCVYLSAVLFGQIIGFLLSASDLRKSLWILSGQVVLEGNPTSRLDGIGTKASQR